MGPAIPEAERPPLRRARRRHRQEQLAGLGRGIRRDRRLRLGPGRRRRRLPRRRPRPAAEDRRGARSGGDRLLGRPQHLPARRPDRDGGRDLRRRPRKVDAGGGTRDPLQGKGSDMKAVVLNAEWAPREGVKVDPEHEKRKWAVNANLVYRNPEATFETVDDPSEPGPRELILKVGACGICGSDVHMFETDDEGYMFLPYHLQTPVVTGHEFSGEVVAIGSEVKEFQVGDLVTSEEIQWCGECDACRGGYWNQCLYIEDLGFTLDGGFAEYAKVNVKYCWSLNSVLERYGDKKMALEVGSMSEPCSVAYEGMFTRAGGFLPGRDVAVFGGGPIGLAATALAKAAGASRIFAFEVLPERRELCEKLGATHGV